MAAAAAAAKGARAARVATELRAAGSVFAEDEAALLIEAANDDDDDDDDDDRLRALVAERVAGRPLEYLLGWAAFAGLRVRVADGVFVPRLRSGLLVRETLRVVTGIADPRVLELCCGTAAVSAAIVAGRPVVRVVAADLDPRAVDCARRNLRPTDTVVLGDLYDPVPGALRGAFDVIVANAPYVPTDELAFLPQEARLHEARTALDGGPDGTTLQARVAEGALGWLSPGGVLLVETSERQADLTAALFASAGLVPRILVDDSLGAVCVAGQEG